MIHQNSSSMHEPQSDKSSDGKTGRSSTYDISEIQDEELLRVDTEADISEMLETCSDIDVTENDDLSVTEYFVDTEIDCDKSKEDTKTQSDIMMNNTSCCSNTQDEGEDEDTDVDITDDDDLAVDDDELHIGSETDDYWLWHADDDSSHLRFDDDQDDDDDEDDLSDEATENPSSCYYYSNAEDVDSSDLELEDGSCRDVSHNESYT
ncbi:unnamed protein product [Meganyctiphanes norvegica]|uniref:Uncharacterized protein n=1 Tax=Meganyctiphanes norvegica TaxID=48144 RepID=A0AAV2QZ89_MEGNR